MPPVPLVVPSGRTVRVFRPGAETGPLTGSDAADFGEILPGFRLGVDNVFSALRGRPA